MRWTSLSKAELNMQRLELRTESIQGRPGFNEMDDTDDTYHSNGSVPANSACTLEICRRTFRKLLHAQRREKFTSSHEEFCSFWGCPKIQVVATTCYNSTTSWGDLYGQFTSEVYPMISRRTPIRRFWVPDFHRLRGEQLGGAKPDTSGCSDRGHS